jgi:hypothetical protein
MASEKVYAAGIAAALAVEQQIIAEEGVPSIFVPEVKVEQYAARVSKAVIDAAAAASEAEIAAGAADGATA